MEREDDSDDDGDDGDQKPAPIETVAANRTGPARSDLLGARATSNEATAVGSIAAAQVGPKPSTAAKAATTVDPIRQAR